MTDVEVLAALDDRLALALTAWGEARQIPRTDPRDHSPVEELIAVMCVVRNRAARQRTRSYKAICLAPQQFSCWNPNSGANHDALMALARLTVQTAPILGSGEVSIDPLLRECLYLADGVIAGWLLDRTGGATSYWAPAAMVPPGRVPSWAAGAARLSIGDQIFVNV